MAEMKKFDALKNEVVRNGGFFVRFYFDMHAGDAPSLQNIMVGFTGRLTNEPGVRMAVGEVDEPMAHDNMYSTTARVTLLVNDFATLARITMSYAPIGIELEEPTDPKIGANDLQAGLITVSSMSQELTQHILTKSMSPAERQNFEKQMGQRAELGKRLIDQQKHEEKKA